MAKIDPKKVKKMQRWLSAQGAEILPLTNEYEVLRFKVPSGVGVIYKNTKGKCNPGNDLTQKLYDDYEKGNKLKDRPKKRSRSTSPRAKKMLRARDGDNCFYCEKLMDPNEMTEEHLLSMIHGGNNRIENKVLCCSDFNEYVGHKTLKEKFEYAMANRLKKAG